MLDLSDEAAHSIHIIADMNVYLSYLSKSNKEKLHYIAGDHLDSIFIYFPSADPVTLQSISTARVIKTLFWNDLHLYWNNNIS